MNRLRQYGDGRYDISLFPREDRYPVILMELKWPKDLNAGELSGLADEADTDDAYIILDVDVQMNLLRDIFREQSMWQMN